MAGLPLSTVNPTASHPLRLVVANQQGIVHIVQNIHPSPGTVIVSPYRGCTPNAVVEGIPTPQICSVCVCVCRVQSISITVNREYFVSKIFRIFIFRMYKFSYVRTLLFTNTVYFRIPVNFRIFKFRTHNVIRKLL